MVGGGVYCRRNKLTATKNISMKRVFANFQLINLFSVFILLLVLNQSCRKNPDVQKEVQEEAFQKHPLTDKFYELPVNASPLIKKIADAIKNEDVTGRISSAIINKAGLPYWEKPMIFSRNSGNSQPVVNALEQDSSNTDTLYVNVPLVPVNTREVDGLLACKVFGDSIIVKFVNEKNFKQFGFNLNSTTNAHRLIGIILTLQHNAFGTRSFELQDGRLFTNDLSSDSTKKKIIKLKINDTTQNFGNNNSEVTTTRCVTSEINCGDPFIYGTCSFEICYNTFTGNVVSSSMEYGNEFIVGGTSGNTSWANQVTGGNGGGGGGHGGAGGSASSLYQLTKNFLLTPAEYNTLLLSEDIVAEAYEYYIYNYEPDLTESERHFILRSHINYMSSSSDYLGFALTSTNSNLQTYGWSMPWWNALFIEGIRPDLYANIRSLIPTAKQAYYLWNNPVRSVEINNNGQFSSLSTDIRYRRIKFHIDKLMSNSNYGLFISNYAAANNGNIMWWENPIFNTGNNVDWNFWIDVNAKIPSNTNGSENYEYIQNIEDYLKCFNDGKTASSYELKIYIDDPAGDGAFQPDYIKKGIKDAGHTFVEVIKNNTDGTKVSQLIGFYPDPNNLPNLQNTSTISKLKNDSKHEFDSKIEMYITGANFNTVLDQIRNYSTGVYDFETFNCTSFAQQVSSSIGITLPSGYRTFGERGGRTYSGVCPTGLQQDIFNWPNKPANVHNVQKYNVSQNASIGNGKCP